MAWRSHGTDNHSLVKKLKEHGIVQSEEVMTTMLAVDRGRYVEHRAYEDAPQRIGFNVETSLGDAINTGGEQLPDQAVA